MNNLQRHESGSNTIGLPEAWERWFWLVAESAVLREARRCESRRRDSPRTSRPSFRVGGKPISRSRSYINVMKMNGVQPRGNFELESAAQALSVMQRHGEILSYLQRARKEAQNAKTNGVNRIQVLKILAARKSALQPLLGESKKATPRIGRTELMANVHRGGKLYVKGSGP